MNNLTKAIAICLFFILLIGILPNNFKRADGTFFSFNGAGYDYQFHLEKAQGHEKSDGKETKWYAPFFHFLASPFAFNEKPFYLFTLFLIAFVTPMLLFFITRNWISSLFFFLTSEYFWFIEQGIYPQGLIGIFILTSIVVKDYKYKWIVRIVLLLLSILTHSVGFFAVGLVLFFLVLYEGNLLNKAVNFLPACSGLFGKSRPNILDNRILVSNAKENLASVGGTLHHQVMNGFRISFILKYLFQIFPFPFLLMALHSFWKNNGKHFIVLIGLFTLAGFLDNYRVWYFVPLIGIIGLTKFYSDHKNLQKWILLMAVICGLVQFYIWFNYKWSCFPL